MRIIGNKSLTGVQGRSTKKKTSSDGGIFSLSSDEEATETGSLAGGSSIQGMDALLALQEIYDEPDRRSKAAKRGHSLLDGLESIRADLLAGHVSEDQLEALACEVSQQGSSGDPKVDEVIEEIELRVRVELAKLGRFPD